MKAATRAICPDVKVYDADPTADCDDQVSAFQDRVTLAIRSALVAARRDEKGTAVTVSDEGPGIPQTELKRVFRRFYRVPGPLASRIKGTGLGLYIVRSVARRHGG